MKEFLKMLCMLTAILSILFGILLVLRHMTKRTYITIEED